MAAAAAGDRRSCEDGKGRAFKCVSVKNCSVWIGEGGPDSTSTLCAAGSSTMIDDWKTLARERLV